MKDIYWNGSFSDEQQAQFVLHRNGGASAKKLSTATAPAVKWLAKCYLASISGTPSDDIHKSRSHELRIR